MTNITAALTEIDTLTSAVANAMAEVSSFLGREEIDYEDNFDVQHEARFIIEHREPLRKKLTETLDIITNGWNDIIQNDLLKAQVNEYLKMGMDFTDKVDKFDLTVCNTEHDVFALVGDSWFARQLLVVMYDWKKSVKFLTEFMQRAGVFEPRLVDPFETAVRKLRPFFTGVGANALKALVLDGVSLAEKQRWIRDRRQAVIFMKMLGISCRDMNRSFLFTSRDGKDRQLKESSDRPDLDYSCYEIYPILLELKEAMG